MRCPYCRSESNIVIDKRESDDNLAIRRRRECNSCEKRFTTYERVELVELYIVKKDGSRENFDREKLMKGLKIACQKRPIKHESIINIADSIEGECRKKNKTEISTHTIGEMVMKKLKKLDKVAYIRFASVYREFEDLKSFEKEVKDLEKKA